MQITFNLPHVFSAVSSKVDNAYALRALLDCQVSLGLGYLRRHAVPGLYQSGVVYARTYIWEPLAALYLPNKHRISGSIYWKPVGLSGGKKKGDCKSLAPALIAELLHTGYKARPVFRFVPRDDGSGALDFHILVQTDHPRAVSGWMDPSKDLGMGKNEVARFFGPSSYGFDDY